MTAPKEGLDPLELAWAAMIEAISSGWVPDGSRFDDVRLSQIGGMLVLLQSGQKEPVLHDRRNLPSGTFAVDDDAGRAVAGTFATNAEAWLWIDRHEGDPINAAERRSEWIISKILGGDAA